MIDPFEVLRAELVRAAETMTAGATAQVEGGRKLRWPGWLRRRSHPLALVAAALVITGSAAAAVVSLTAGRSQPLAGTVPGQVESASLAGYRYTITVSPSLDAGGAGWNSSISYSRGGQSGFGEGGGGAYATSSNPFLGGDGGAFSIAYPSPSRRGDTVGYVLTGPAVAAVRIGNRTIATFSSPSLPGLDRAAVFFLPTGSPQLVSGWAPGQPIRSYLHIPAEPGYRGPHKIPTLAVLPLTRNGEVIPTRLTNPSGSFPSFWQAPSAVTPNIHEPPYHGPAHPLSGVCELGEHGLPALTPEWGHAIRTISPATDSVGELFLSCVDTEYYLHGWPLQAGVLLDARQPGRVLGTIPGAHPVPGRPDIVNFDAGQLSARRQGQAWLVVEGGSSPAQRLRVLRALSISKLPVHHVSAGLAPH
jgi:hypothetical protein